MTEKLEAALAEIRTLRAAATRWTPQQDASTTHWDTCYLEHKACALAKIESLRAEIERIKAEHADHLARMNAEAQVLGHRRTAVCLKSCDDVLRFANGAHASCEHMAVALSRIVDAARAGAPKTALGIAQDALAWYRRWERERQQAGAPANHGAERCSVQVAFCPFCGKRVHIEGSQRRGGEYFYSHKRPTDCYAEFGIIARGWR